MAWHGRPICRAVRDAAGLQIQIQTYLASSPWPSSPFSSLPLSLPHFLWLLTGPGVTHRWAPHETGTLQ